MQGEPAAVNARRVRERGAAGRRGHRFRLAAVPDIAAARACLDVPAYRLDHVDLCGFDEQQAGPGTILSRPVVRMQISVQQPA